MNTAARVLIPPDQVLFDRIRKFKSELQRHKPCLEGITGYVDCISLIWDFLSIEYKLTVQQSKDSDTNSVPLTDFQNLILRLSFYRRCTSVNRSYKIGERITPQHVFFGNPYDPVPRPVDYWLTVKHEPKGGWNYSDIEHMNGYDLVNEEINRIFSCHKSEVLALIERIFSY